MKLTKRRMTRIMRKMMKLKERRQKMRPVLRKTQKKEMLLRSNPLPMKTAALSLWRQSRLYKR